MKSTRNNTMAAVITREFLDGYASVAGSSCTNIEKLAKSRRYIESFYPVLMPSVALAVKKVIKSIAAG